MWYAVFIRSFHKSIDTVIYILLNRVVHRALTVGRTSTVIVDTETTTTIHIFDIISHLMQLDIELRGFSKSRLYAAYLCNLTTNMEMNQFKTVIHTFLIESIKSLKQFTASQAELTCVAATLLPFSTSRRSQFNTYTEIRFYANLFGSFSNDIEFVKFLDDDKDALTHLLGK